MATLVLGAAGSAVGGAVGGSLLGVGAATLGQALGGVAGAVADSALLGQIQGSGARVVETGQATALRIQTATEGRPVPLTFARTRVAAQLIWATRFLETVTETTEGGSTASGGKGLGGLTGAAGGASSSGSAPTTVREYSYSISVALGLCEGPIDRVGRIWADGKLLDVIDLTMRVHEGTDGQSADPKIEAVEGAANVPAYRGLAYIVFEDLPLKPFGNRIPQFNVEVFRSPDTRGANLDPEETGEPLRQLIDAVALSPGSGEFALDPTAARYTQPAGGGTYANRNNPSRATDMIAALRQLRADLPKARAVNLIVSWFGDDLRCGRCSVTPRVEEQSRASSPVWSVSGATTATARLVGRDSDDRPIYGGTPDDGSVIRAIRELRDRGLDTMLYPFLLMDIAAGNTLTNPYDGTSGQPVYPWRGRITLDRAPGVPGSDDQTAAAADDVAAFFGTARAAHFQVSPNKVVYTGPDEWTWRRFVLHLAALGAAAGGVESICIGTEMRGLTTIRSGLDTFPAVDELRSLADHVRVLLPNAKISYAADWSEYFGYHPGNGDVFFHLDPLWADSNIDFVGIDDYTPLSDWRHLGDHADREAQSVYSLKYLKSQIEGGEYYDYYYKSTGDKRNQTRSPITDGAHDEPWVFRPKDIRNWWSHRHYNRIGGVRQTTSTAWRTEAKPIRLTETGCPAVDLGGNQPNLFVDPKSSESALPFGSRGARDDEIQRRFLQAKIGYWTDNANNPVSAKYGGRMIPEGGIYVGTWDSRPWPDFPLRESVWSDGPSYHLEPWLTGRVPSGSLAEIVAEICERAGFRDYDVSLLFGSVDGYLMDRTQTAREALQPLMLAFGFDAYESAGRVIFALRGTAVPGAALITDRLLPGDGPDGAPVTCARTAESGLTDAVRFTFHESEVDYRVAAVEARLPGGGQTRVSETSLGVTMTGSRAHGIAERWLAESSASLDTAQFALPPSALGYEPGDVVRLGDGEAEYRIDRIAERGGRIVEATRIEPGLYAPTPAPERSVEPERIGAPGPVSAVLLDLPLADGGGFDHLPRIAVAADPWPGTAAVYRSATTDGFRLATVVSEPAGIGMLGTDLAPGAPNRWQNVSVEVVMATGRLAAATALDVLNGANALAVELSDGIWEVLQFREAVLIDTDRYRLSTLLRGQRGTAPLVTGAVAAGARVVALDSAIAPLPVLADEIGLARVWRTGPGTLPVSDDSYVEETRTFSGIGLRPFAPVHLTARTADDETHLTWIRTTRVGGDRWEGLDVPLGEEREIYRVTVLRDGQPVRFTEVGTPGFTYTALMRTEDGGPGPVTFRVAQGSTAFGFGLAQEITTDV